MIKNKQSTRSLTAFLVTWAFFVLTVTGIVLYIVPQGRVAYWVHWSLAGLEKEQWGWIHMMFGGVFIVTSILHLYFNWKPFKKYLAGRVQGQLQVTRELVVSLLLTLLITVLSVYNLPPASWVFDLNESIKNAWITSPELEPPFGHAEEASLAGIARRTDLDLKNALAALRVEGIRFNSEHDSLEQVGRSNGITPMEVYAVMQRFEKVTEPLSTALIPEEVEARFAGTGLGRKSLSEICEKLGLDIAVALERLEAAGIPGRADDNARELSERHGLSPIDLMKVMLVPGFRPGS